MVLQALNPYSNTNSIKDPALFFNREAQIGILLNLLFSGSMQCLSLIGPRKSGKTALVEHLFRPDTITRFGYESSNHLFVTINCAKYPAALRSREDFYRLLMRCLYSEVEKTIPDVLQGMIIDMRAPLSWQEEWDSLLQKLTDHQFSVVVALDAFDRVLDEEKPITDGLFGSLRAYGEEPNFAWITCTFEPLPLLFQKAYQRFAIPEVKRRSESEFPSSFVGYHVMSLFAREDIEKIITGPSTAHGIVFSLKEQQAIRRFGGRFPYFIQRACHLFFEAHLQGEIRDEEIIEQCCQEAHPFWEGYWNRLTSQQQSILFTIASDHPVPPSSMLTTQSLKDTALIFEEYGQWFPFSEAFGRFIRTKEHAYVGRPVNPGELLWKQYKVEAIAGRTLHSQVVKAQDTLLQQYWAVKLLCINQDHTNKQISEYQERLLREARILTSLKHKNIGQVHEVRLNPLGVIMPWVEGKSLLHWLEEEASLLPSVVIQIGYDLADALYYAHQKKITHRDIKPNNIILNTNAEPILIDFDVARSQNHNTITYNMQNGASLEVGNVEYGAPEQFAHPDLVGPPADIFALGAVLYRLLTHEQPYPYGNDARGYPDVLLPPLEQQEIPDALYSVLCVMLHQYPEERPGADEVCSKLKQCLIPLKS